MKHLLQKLKSILPRQNAHTDCEETTKMDLTIKRISDSNNVVFLRTDYLE